MNSATPIKSLTVRNDEAQVLLVENEAAVAAAKARYWRGLASLVGLAQLALIGVAIAVLVSILLGLTPWF